MRRNSLSDKIAYEREQSGEISSQNRVWYVSDFRWIVHQHWANECVPRPFQQPGIRIENMVQAWGGGGQVSPNGIGLAHWVTQWLDTLHASQVDHNQPIESISIKRNKGHAFIKFAYGWHVTYPSSRLTEVEWETRLPVLYASGEVEMSTTADTVAWDETARIIRIGRSCRSTKANTIA